MGCDFGSEECPSSPTFFLPSARIPTVVLHCEVETVMTKASCTVTEEAWTPSHNAIILRDWN